MKKCLSEEKHSYSYTEKKEKLHDVMKKHENRFHGKKGVCKGQEVSLKLKDGAEPCIAKPHGMTFPQRENF